MVILSWSLVAAASAPGPPARRPRGVLGWLGGRGRAGFAFRHPSAPPETQSVLHLDLLHALRKGEPDESMWKDNTIEQAIEKDMFIQPQAAGSLQTEHAENFLAIER